ncbi:MAG: ThiF family adenylyltransferase [Bdellovibrionales bacterium]|nr:ThiF family adenylyltransferase [Bdellovibrionales bacterium]
MENNRLSNFDYDLAFSRNLGWLTPEDQKLLSNKRIAIPGLGGVGGHHFQNLVRLGFQKFNLADPDIYELQNFNRQGNATIPNLGKKKLDAVREWGLSVNPNIEFKLFYEGVHLKNYEEFLEGVDLIVDGLDLFAMNERIELYELAHKKGIPVITAGPFGMGTSIMGFHPKKMSFNEYFDLDHKGLTTEGKIIRFLAGVTPSMMHQKYLRSPSHVDLFERRLPSLNIGCLAAGAALGSMAIESLLDIENTNIRWAPKGFHVDFNLQRSVRFWRPWGNKNPLQKLKIKAYHLFFNKKEFI